MGALPATSRHPRRLPWLLPSGPDLVNRVALRENQQAPIESVDNQRAGALSLCEDPIASDPEPDAGLLRKQTQQSGQSSFTMAVQMIPTGAGMDEHDSFPQRVWQIVASIPEGYVTTYGDVAQLAGSPRAARQVGGVLKRLPEGSTLPWHRVVNRHGAISLTGPDLQRQRQALLSEGVQVSGSGQIDLQKYRWVY